MFNYNLSIMSSIVQGVTSTLEGDAPGDFNTKWTIPNAAVSTSYHSQTVVLKDIGIDKIITAQAGTTYSINGRIYTTAAGTVSDGDMVTCQLESAGSYETTVVGGLVIDGIACDFTIITETANGWTDIEYYSDGSYYTY